MARPKKPLAQQKGHLTSEFKTRRAAEEKITSGASPLQKTPPCYLIDKIANNEWRRIVSELKKSVNMVNALDLANLVGYCNAYSMYRRATRDISKLEKLTIETPNGGEAEHPLINIQKKYATEMREFARVCGITVDGRLKFGAEEVRKIEKGLAEDFGDI